MSVLRQNVYLNDSKTESVKLHFHYTLYPKPYTLTELTHPIISYTRLSEKIRGVAQPGRAPGSGPGGRRFKSSRPDFSGFGVYGLGYSYLLYSKGYTPNPFLFSVIVFAVFIFNVFTLETKMLTIAVKPPADSREILELVLLVV